MQTKTAGLQVDMRLLEENGRFDRAEMVQFGELSRWMGHCITSLLSQNN